VREAWEALRRRIQPFIGETEGFVISDAEYARLLQAADAKLGPALLREQLLELRNEPTQWRLERAREMLLSTCQKLDKPQPVVEIVHNGLRLPPERLRPFWVVFSHLLNNAADHGVQSAEERLACGKPGHAAIKLVTRLERGELVVELTDDGKGIDWPAVATLATQRGLPAHDRGDLTRALLSDGFSLRTTVSETSGRGVGMAAVNAVVQSLGGKLELDSEPQRGTCWRVRFPQVTRDAAHATESRDSIQGSARGPWSNKEAV